MLKQVAVDDIGWIVFQMETQNPMWETYINLRNGEIVSTEAGNVTEDQLDAEPDRYFLIEPFPSGEGFRVMEDFVREEVNEEDIADRLNEALAQKKPFRRFKDVLMDFPKLRDRFEEFKYEKMKTSLAEELLLRGYEIVEKPRKKQDTPEVDNP